jgi:hypothetical protein
MKKMMTPSREPRLLYVGNDDHYYYYYYYVSSGVVIGLSEIEDNLTAVES